MKIADLCYTVSTQLYILDFPFKHCMCMSWCCDCMYVCVPCSCLVPVEVRRGSQISGSWRYEWLWTTQWVLGIKPRSSGRKSNHLSTPNCILTRNVFKL